MSSVSRLDEPRGWAQASVTCVGNTTVHPALRLPSAAWELPLTNWPLSALARVWSQSSGLAVKEIVKTSEQLWLGLFSSGMGNRFAGFRVLQIAKDLISGDPIAKSQAEAWSLSKSGPRWAVRTRVGALRVNLSRFVVGISQEPALGSGIKLFGELGCWLWNSPSFWVRPLTSTASVLWV